MADPLNNNFDDLLQKAAEVRDDPSLGDASFSATEGQATMTLQVEFGPKMLLTLRDILGYSFVVNEQADKGKRLARRVPMRHPLYWWMRATRITSVKFKGLDDNTYTGQNQISTTTISSAVITVADSQALVVGMTVIGTGIPDGTTISSIGANNQVTLSQTATATGAGSLTFRHTVGQKYGTSSARIDRYTRAEITIAFSKLGYDVLTDQDLVTFGKKEYDRYVEKKPKSRTQMLSTDKSEFRFNDPATTNTSTLKQAVGRLVQTDTLEWVWHQVPEDWVMDARGIPVNIYACVGKVNAYTFAGFLPGNLYLEDPDIVPEIGTPEELFNPAKPWKVPRTYRITLPFKYFEPPSVDRQTDTGLGSQTAGYRMSASYGGHNLKPDPKDASGRWFRIMTTAGGAPLYQSVNFEKIFRPVLSVAAD